MNEKQIGQKLDFFTKNFLATRLEQNSLKRDRTNQTTEKKCELLNQFSYLNVLEHDLWPVLRERRNLRRIWFMQDGATCHCTGRVLSWLGTKFNDRIISRRTPIPWPPQSPDLNPLDFWLWGHLGKIVHGANPRSIDELMQTVEDARNTITPDNIEESLRNLTKRLQSCVAQNGGHFQHLL